MNKIALKHYMIQKIRGDRQSLRFLDVGCGEGWALKYFKNQGWKVLGLDYSSYGCERMNPDCMSDLLTGDIFQNLKILIQDSECFDVILLDNVLEHVLEPGLLLEELKKLANPDTILIIEVPNDFSIIQRELYRLNKIQTPFWIAIPDHISYFNKEGLVNLCKFSGWNKKGMIADYPIDLNLFVEETNYVENKKIGKSMHKKRVLVENLFHDISIEKTIELYTVLAEMGLGRNITGFFQLEGEARVNSSFYDRESS